MKILDGKTLSEKILKQISETVQSISARPPRLDMIIVGNDFASEKYVMMKEKKAKEVGFDGAIHRLARDCTESEILQKISELNSYDLVDGFMVQLPIPGNHDSRKLIDTISVEKDVDGLTSTSLGRVFKGQEGFAPATAVGVMKLFAEYEIGIKGARVVIIGASDIIGLPLLGLMQLQGATVTIANEFTKDLSEITSQADIVVSAVGQPKLIKSKYIKLGAVVIDVGISKDPLTGKLSGDVDFEDVSNVAAYITPVPGGVGPMTVACLLENTLSAWKLKTQVS